MNVSKANEPNSNSSLTEIFSHLGSSCTVPLIFALGENSYNTDVSELRRSISYNDGIHVSDSKISRCLSNLSQIGLVRGIGHNNPPMKSEFSLTSKGQQLYRHLLQIRALTERSFLDTDVTDNISAC
jgi:DNA-binding HxlR family transcriptional regulator